MNQGQALAALQHGFDPYSAHGDTSGFFSSIAHAVGSAAKGIVHQLDPRTVVSNIKRGAHDITHPKDLLKDVGKGAKMVKGAIPIVQQVVKNLGPLGMVASGALGAMNAGLSGQNLEKIAWAAAEGAAPIGIDKAIGAAHAIRNGSNVLQAAINAGAGQFLAGSAEKLGFDSAIKVLKDTGSKVALGVARRALPSEGARRAFDAAIGTVSQAVSSNPAGLLKRAGGIPEFSLSRAKGIISPYAPNLKHAIETMSRNPTLTGLHPMVLANQFGTSQQTILQALKHVSGKRLLPWRSLSPAAASFVQKWNFGAPMRALTHGTGDTAGLDETGTKYIVAKGDSPFSIAQKLTGSGANWTQLRALNTDKKPTIDKNVWVGEVLNIPASWQRPISGVTQSPGPASAGQPSAQQPSGPLKATPPTFSTAPGVLQAKSILVAWGKTDGVNAGGLPDYGSNAADLSTSFGARDKLQLMAFQSWDNKTASAGLAVDGILGPKSLTALQQWAESRATQALPTPVGPVVIPGGGTVTTLPEVVITASPPALPTAASPVPVALPPAPAIPTPALPPVATPAQPATPATVAASSPSGSGSKMGPALAGAAVGGVMFGLPGAIIGGVAGAAIS